MGAAQLHLCCSGVRDHGADRRRPRKDQRKVAFQEESEEAQLYLEADGCPPEKDPRKVVLQEESEEAQLYEEDLTLIGEGTSLQDSLVAAAERRSMRKSIAPDMAKLTTHEQHLLNLQAKRDQADDERKVSSFASRENARRSEIIEGSRKYLRSIYSRLAKTPSLQERVAVEIQNRRTRCDSDSIIALAQKSSLEQHQSNLEKIRSSSADSLAMSDQRRLSNTSVSSFSGGKPRALTLQDDLVAEVHRRTLRQNLCASRLTLENTTEAASSLRHTLRLQSYGASRLTNIRSTEAAFIESGNQEADND